MFGDFVGSRGGERVGVGGYFFFWVKVLVLGVLNFLGLVVFRNLAVGSFRRGRYVFGFCCWYLEFFIRVIFARFYWSFGLFFCVYSLGL